MKIITKEKKNIFLLSTIVFIFTLLIYLSIPVFYNYETLQIELQNKINKEFDLNIQLSKEIKYRFFPKPYFEVTNSNLYLYEKNESNKISDIKRTIVELSFLGLHNQKKIEIKKVKFLDAIFNIEAKDWLLIKKILKKKLSKKEILVKNSKVFYNNKDETVAIILINKINVQYLNKKSINKIKGNGNLYNSDFEIEWKREFENPYSTNLSLKFPELGLKVNNVYERDVKNTSQFNGKNIVTLPKSLFKTFYKREKKIVSFFSENLQIGQTKGEYNGKINFSPFNFDINLNLKEISLAQLLDENFLYLLLNKIPIFYHQNFSGKINMKIDELKSNNKLFHSIDTTLLFQNNIIQIVKLNLISNIYGTMNLNGILDEQNNLQFDIYYNVKNLRKLYSKFQMPKKYRYDFQNFSLKGNHFNDQQKITLNEFAIDKIKSEEKLNYLNNFIKDYLKNNELSTINFLEFKKIVNDLIFEN